MPFGRKFILFSGDFRQILQVVPRGSRGMIIFTCSKSSLLYQTVSLLGPNENIRLQAIMNEPSIDNDVLECPQYLLKDGEGKVHEIVDSSIELPSAANIVNSSEKFVESVFCALKIDSTMCHGSLPELFWLQQTVA